MPKIEKYRALYVLNYLMDNTNEYHTVSLKDIVKDLQDIGINSHLRTVDEDIKALMDWNTIL